MRLLGRKLRRGNMRYWERVNDQIIKISIMILIISTDNDVSTYHIKDWLDAMNEPYLFIHDKMQFQFLYHYIEKKELVFLIDGKEYNLLKCKAIWYRRYDLSYTHFGFSNHLIKDDVTHITYNTKIEFDKFLSVLFYHLKSIKYLSAKDTCDINKLCVLEKAKQRNIQVPYSCIVTQKKQMESLLEERKTPFITKAIDELFMSNKIAKGKHYISYTTEINSETLAPLPDFFAPSLLQEKIDKVFELRIFFLEDIFYPMAIFSQNDKQTQVDFRKYNYKQPNRSVPYMLPKAIENNLRLLMNDLSLNTGSIDMIYTNKKEYVFLEVNPVGQFGMTSYPCNYYLEKKIATYLSS